MPFAANLPVKSLIDADIFGQLPIKESYCMRHEAKWKRAHCSLASSFHLPARCYDVGEVLFIDTYTSELDGSLMKIVKRIKDTIDIYLYQ